MQLDELWYRFVNLQKSILNWTIKTKWYDQPWLVFLSVIGQCQWTPSHWIYPSLILPPLYTSRCVHTCSNIIIRKMIVLEFVCSNGVIHTFLLKQIPLFCIPFYIIYKKIKNHTKSKTYDKNYTWLTPREDTKTKTTPSL